MLKMCVVVAACSLSAARGGAQAAPSTDIYLAQLTRSAHDSSGFAIGKPVNITHRAGYDNQPAFTPDGRAIYYTSRRDDDQADIYRYVIGSRQTSRVTATPESEYSPTFMPGGRRFSVVRVERDSTQRLWSFAMDGSDPRLLLRTIKPVGYHAWLDSTHVALFVLGNPATLQVATIGTERVDTIAQNIGRSLSVEGPGRVSFVKRRPDSSYSLGAVELDPRTGHFASLPRTVAELPAGAEYIVWLSPNDALATSGSKVYALRPAPVDYHWAVVADLSGQGIQHISRLAVSPNGRWVAFVADDAKP